MITTTEWISLDEALERLKLAAGNTKAVDVAACSEFLTTLTIQPNEEHGFPLSPIVRQTWVVSCEDVLRPPPDSIPSWQEVCMPLEGWVAWRKLVYRDKSFEAWALTRCVQERFACKPAGRTVHLLDPNWRPILNTAHSCCKAEGQSILLATDASIITCTECKATTVEKALR